MFMACPPVVPVRQGAARSRWQVAKENPSNCRPVLPPSLLCLVAQEARSLLPLLGARDSLEVNEGMCRRTLFVVLNLRIVNGSEVYLLNLCDVDAINASRLQIKCLGVILVSVFGANKRGSSYRYLARVLRGGAEELTGDSTFMNPDWVNLAPKPLFLIRYLELARSKI